jgi:HK97 family phage prohead protease
MHFKDFKIKKASKDKPVTFVASTSDPDRYGDVVDQKGWDLRAYERNPVILFNHNPSQMPIGRGKAYIKNGQLMIDVEFDKNDEQAQKIERKVRDGYINAVSVGFQASEAISRNRLPTDHKYFGKSGQYFPKSELLEVSIVTIPANNMATLSKNYVQKISLLDVAKSFIVNKHIVSIQELDNGNYLVEFAGHDMKKDEAERQEMMDEEEDKAHDPEHGDEYKMEEEEEKTAEEEEEKAGHEEEEEKSFSVNDTLGFDFNEFLQELKTLNKRQ